MESRKHHVKKRRGGSLVMPILLITVGILFLLDNLGALPNGAWNTIWRLWPVVIIAIGLEILLGRRVSFGAILILVVVVIIAGAVVWWSVIAGSVETVEQSVHWPRDDVESADIEIDASVGALTVSSQEDMADVMYAELVIPENAKVYDDFDVSKRGRAKGELRLRDNIWLPFLLNPNNTEWNIFLHPKVRLEELKIDSAIGDVKLDLAELEIDHLDLNLGIGECTVTLSDWLPEKGRAQVYIHMGIGDAQIEIPKNVQARVRIDRGIGGLEYHGHFEHHGDYYQTEDLDTSEGYIDIEIDVGIGDITLR